MNSTSIISRIRQAAREFRRADQGNIAVMFSIAILPILGLVGAAIDYSRVNNARTAMQAAIDATALMISKEAAGLTAAQVTSKAQAYFAAMYKHPEATGVSVTATYTPNTGSGATVVISGSGSMATDFMKVAGYPSLSFGSSATTRWGNTKLRVAMALDVTGSMASDGKMPALKTAAKALVDTLKSSASATGDVYISIIPFAQMVNVGKSNKDESWIDWELHGECSSSSYKSKTACQNADKDWDSYGKSNWKGCVTDRNQPYDTTKDAPTTAATKFSAVRYEQGGSNICPAKILPMTSAYSAEDVQTIKDKIDDLEPAGGTNQPIGMAWAWMALQSGDPLNTPVKDANHTYTDVIILMSDGLNTIDRWYGNGSDHSTAVDGRQQILCDNIKNPINGKTAVYTIQVNTDGDPESAILKSCADVGSFYPATTTSGIASAFNSIGTSLTKLRLAK